MEGTGGAQGSGAARLGLRAPPRTLILTAAALLPARCLQAGSSTPPYRVSPVVPFPTTGGFSARFRYLSSQTSILPKKSSHRECSSVS